MHADRPATVVVPTPVEVGDQLDTLNPKFLARLGILPRNLRAPVEPSER